MNYAEEQVTVEEPHTGSSPGPGTSVPDNDPAVESPQKPTKDPGRFFTRTPWGYPAIVIMLFFFLNLAMALAVVLAGPAIFIPEFWGGRFPVIFGLMEVGPVPALVYYIFLVSIIALCFYKAVSEDGAEFLRLLGLEFGSSPKPDDPGTVTIPQEPKEALFAGKTVFSPSVFSSLKGNVFVLLALLLFSIYCFEFFFDILVVDILGFQRNVPASIFDVPSWQRLMDLPEAPVAEELLSRVMLIGFPLYVIHTFGRNDKGAAGHEVSALVLGLFKKENRRYIMGGGFDWDQTTMLVLLFSSGFFALIHIGWDWTKLFPTFLGGMILGVLFLRKGLHASILLHFAVNSFGISYLVAGEPLVLEYFLTVIWLGGICMGIYFLATYLGHFRDVFKALDMKPKTPGFSRSMAALGGTVLFTVAFIAVFYALMSGLDRGGDETDQEHHFWVESDDFRILDLGSFGDGAVLNGSVSLQGEGGEVDFLLSNKAVMEKWKSGEEIGDEEYLYQAELSGTGDGAVFRLELEGGLEVYVIVFAKEQSQLSLNLTTRSPEVQGNSWEGLLCGFPIALVIFGGGLGCIYVSNYRQFSRTGSKFPQPPFGHQSSQPGPYHPYPPQQAGYPPQQPPHQYYGPPQQHYGPSQQPPHQYYGPPQQPPQQQPRQYYGPPQQQPHQYYGPPQQPPHQYYGPPQQQPHQYYGPPQQAPQQYNTPAQQPPLEDLPGDRQVPEPSKEGASPGEETIEYTESRREESKRAVSERVGGEEE